MARFPNLGGLLGELRRRHVVRIAIVYAITAWLLLQIAAIVLPTFGAPHWVLKVVIGLFILFFPVALLLAWAFEITPGGVRRTPPQAHPLAAKKAKDTGGLLRSLAGRKTRRRQQPRSEALTRTPRSREAPVTVRSPARGPHAGTAPGVAPSQKQAPKYQTSAGQQERPAPLARLRHDLRSPINAIVGYAEMLLEEGVAEGDRQTADDVRKIHEAGKELQRVVDGVFDADSFKRQQVATRERREAFAKDVQHRFRTPLNAVIGYTELLLEREKESERTGFTADIEKIGRAGRQLLGQMDEIVDFCAAEAKGEATESDYERMSDIAREALAEIRGVEPNVATIGGALLVVDDNELNRELLAKRLALQGFTVNSAASGEEALERMRSQSFDLILLDVVMPGLNGFEVLGEMKSDRELCDIPVIMISALDEMEAAVRCIEAGAADYITKPFEPVLLRARVTAALRTRELAVASRHNSDEFQVQEELMDRLFEDRFPQSVAGRVRSGETEIAERYEDASIVCVQLLGLSVQVSTRDVLAGLRQLRAVRAWLRKLADEFGIETLIFRDLEALAVAGVPVPRPDHIEAAAGFALRIIEEAAATKEEPGISPRLRLGLHTGTVIAGVAGEESLTYEVWGQPVELARALASGGRPGAVHVSAAVQAELNTRYAFESRGVADLAEHGQLRTYLLSGLDENAS